MAERIEDIAREMVAKGKGILAADESGGTITKRFDALGIKSSEDSRRDYREMLFRAEVMKSAVSGVILYDETIRQKAKDGTPLVELIKAAGAVPGIKVDTGAKDLAFSPGEKITEGLDGLRARLEEYRELGARFAKWRAVITIGDGVPSVACIRANAHALARYAALCQEAGIVPIVEPEVLMDGEHTIEESFEVTRRVLTEVFHQLQAQSVAFEGMLLKPNMVLSGYGAAEQASVEAVADLTVRGFRLAVPAAVPGIVFLSGGQSDELATAHLNAMNQLGPHPWELSFSYGRALQAPALKAWGGQPDHRAAGQAAYLKRARLNGAARRGAYAVAMAAREEAGRFCCKKSGAGR
jgi:fructose-bisphosphate aldolase class I